ncbi:MAG: Crp/Fnr family transcriptional regulator [Bacteroidetes bacterium]|nr:Crp/Fnr family transcriptional regulator [Fibrella sp.]
MIAPQRRILQQHLQAFAQLSDDDVRLADTFWGIQTIARHDFFNFQNSVCRHVSFVIKGIFRVYYMDPKTDREHNLFFIAENTFLASLKSSITQMAYPYNIEALEDTELLVMKHDHLLALYPQSHGWERFGRLLAEQYLILNQARSESFLTRTAEERYVDLLENYPDLLNRVSLGHISSYLGIKGPSLSRIRAQVARGE